MAAVSWCHEEFVDDTNFSTQFIRPERDHQAVTGDVSVYFAYHYPAARGFFAQFCKSLPHLVGRQGDLPGVFGGKRKAHRDHRLVISRRRGSPAEIHLKSSAPPP